MDPLNPDSGFSRIMGEIFDYLKLGFLFLLFSLPIVTAGAAATAAMFVGMKLVRGEAPKLWRPFWQSFRQNFRQATMATLFLLVLAAILGFDWYQLFQMESTMPVRIARGLVFLTALAIMMAALYVFPILARFEVSGRQLVRNAAAFALTNFTNNLLILAIILAGMWLADNALPILPVVIAAMPAIVIRLMSSLCVKSFVKVEVQHDKGDL